MTRKQTLKLTLTAALFFIALGGWLLHLRIHPFTKAEENLIPIISGAFSVFIVPVLFSFRKTMVLAYLYNGFSVIIGTILMAHFSIAHYTGQLSFGWVMIGTLFANISLLWGKFAVGKAIYDLDFLQSETDRMPAGRYFRYPNTGWWFVHLAGWAAVYSLGHILWK